MDGQVAHPRVGIFGDDHAGGQVTPAVALGVVRNRQYIQVRVGLNHFIGRTLFHHHGLDGAFAPGPDIVRQHERQPGARSLEELRHEIPVPIQPEQRRVVPALDVLEQHGFAALEFPGDARQFERRVHLAFHPDKMIMPFHECDIGLQVDEVAFGKVHGCSLINQLSVTRCFSFRRA